MGKRIGIVSYNINCNFTNYGSALQSWALSESIKKLGHHPILIDYCPDILRDKDPLNPIKNMWDTDEESRHMCELSLPAIRINYKKFEDFYSQRFSRTQTKYFSHNFDSVVADEQLDGFVCGSDTIFCIDEFGFDDGYYANYPSMQNRRTISYAASFGDSHFTNESYEILNQRLQNFKALGIRESQMIPYIKAHTDVKVQQVLDPTLLLEPEAYDTLASSRLKTPKYILLYARRYNPKMFEFADKLANQHGWEVIDISLRATNASKHQMFYEAGVEEFLSLIKHAQFVVTNSFHGMILSVQYKQPFVIFSREQCDTKIDELLHFFGLEDHKMITGNEKLIHDIDYPAIHKKIAQERKNSLTFLQTELNKY